MLPNTLNTSIAEIPTIEDQTYIRELLQLAVMDDLLGPAAGPNELIVDMGVRIAILLVSLLHVKQPSAALSFQWIQRMLMMMLVTK